MRLSFFQQSAWMKIFGVQWELKGDPEVAGIGVISSLFTTTLIASSSYGRFGISFYGRAKIRITRLYHVFIARCQAQASFPGHGASFIFDIHKQSNWS
jgi:hypothetical protein